MKNYIFTIARGFGSGGKQIGMQLANELGIECYEHRILALASQYSGYVEAEFKENDERLKGSYLINKLAAIPLLLAATPEEREFREFQSQHIRYYKYQEQIIKELADTRSCVFIGKCADYILKDRKNVISIYIEAPRDFCVQRIQNRMGISVVEANKKIEKTDRYRAEYYEFFTGGGDWMCPVNYDLTINSARVGKVDDLSDCVKLIKLYAQMKFGADFAE
ncbi:MAG: cytidylate kinase-like family protein [Lachnospiraceae bacterium]|nr:cytidylate kinase-like family protein [Lachnospiraceae bacterium]